MNFTQTHLPHRPQPTITHGAAAQPRMTRDAEPSGLTQEEIRRIVLEVLG